MMERCSYCGRDVEIVLTTNGQRFPIELTPRRQGSFYLTADNPPIAIRVPLEGKYRKRFQILTDERWASHIPRCVGLVDSDD